jgi:hypothetical protein
MRKDWPEMETVVSRFGSARAVAEKRSIMTRNRTAFLRKNLLNGGRNLLFFLMRGGREEKRKEYFPLLLPDPPHHP